MHIRFISFYIENKVQCILKDLDLPGNDLNGCKDKTDTAQKCGELCQNTSECVQFTWLGLNFEEKAKRKECCMKNVFSNSYKDLVGAFSGHKNCGKKFELNLF